MQAIRDKMVAGLGKNKYSCWETRVSWRKQRTAPSGVMGCVNVLEQNVLLTSLTDVVSQWSET